MKVLLLNTYAHGGAGIACRRLMSALQESGTQADLLTAADVRSRWPFYAERLSFLPYERDKSVRFAFSLANFGHDLRRHPLVGEADVLHLHWINQGFLSLENIRDLAGLGKPVVWTLHDMWAFTGGCHYSRGCDHYLDRCGRCLYVRRPGASDLSHRIWINKQRLFPRNIHFVTCSEWLAGVARSSALLNDRPVEAIPNPIDTRLFQPLPALERQQARQHLGFQDDDKVLLFAAMKVSDERKGFSYLQSALQCLKKSRPDLPLKILVLGQIDQAARAQLPFETVTPGLISDPARLATLYAASDLFVIPSLEDNLPNTVMESLACGTPVAGFRTGGIPEMAGHLQEGFIAEQKDVEGLAKGIEWVFGLTATDYEHLRRRAREKVEREYKNAVVAHRYLNLYERLVQSL
ncbi:MAG: glycosyltransferase [Saprospiraceae bacterium]|nr:glycosyltransferase [Saprospiraceae bacterium]